MTDKEQIMIDGVDVSRCRYFLKDTEGQDYETDEFVKGCCEAKGSCIGYELAGYGLCRGDKDCYFKQLARKTQECEELKRKLSNQEQLYQNEIEIYNESCLQLRQENDDLYLERLALNTANSGINSLLEIKEQENARYRKALEEIEEYINNQGINHKWNMYIQRFRQKILDIISKAKDGE